MRRMYSENQLIALILKYAQGGGDLSVFAPAYSDESTYAQGDIVSKDDKFYQAKADIGTAEEWNAEHWNEVTFEEALKPYLNGKYARILTNPHNPLTEEELSLMLGGCHVNGTFLNKTNPLILPLTKDESYGYYFGIMISGQDISGIKILISNRTAFNSFTPFVIKPQQLALEIYNAQKFNNKNIPEYPNNSSIGFFICRKGVLQYYIPVAQDNITSGDTIALDSNLGKALIDHLDVEINGYRARYEYTDGNYVVYSSKTEVNSGAKLQVNMISYNTTNGTLAFNQMTFTPDA